MNNSRTVFLLAICWLASMPAAAQHFVGVSGGYATNSLSSSIPNDLRPVSQWGNYGIVYKFYGSAPLWPEGAVSRIGTGLQSGINFTTRGYQRDSTAIFRYRAVEIPFMTHFHASFWKIRVIGAAGLYASYLLDGTQTDLDPLATTPTVIAEGAYSFQSIDRRFDYGLRFGGALALMLHPIEIQFELNYAIGLGYMRDPVIPGQYTVYYRFSQMIFSLNAFIVL
ncbi:MAG: PorT family protein [Prevotellaceae bacterium]|jgi:hypothetical protein|nr:PorT family protein [Prevotellaceae bacterium]